MIDWHIVGGKALLAISRVLTVMIDQPKLIKRNLTKKKVVLDS